ncbi:MAG: AMP-binding protein [Pseudomonadota bacterium]
MTAASFHAARDLLIRHRENYSAAMAEFRWPELPHFNWALDHFDGLARDNDRLALWIVEESGAETRRSFEQLRLASDRAANTLRRLGVRRGDRLLVMLPNRVELWELMLAAMKLGAVLSPATMLLSEADLADRIERGRMRAVIVDASATARFAGIADHCLRIVVGGTAAGWEDYALSASASEAFVPQGATLADDACVLYFTSGTTSKPKMVQHTHRSYPVGHLSTLYWLGLQADDVHLNISSPGWAKHAWSCFFAPWTVGATIFIYNQGRFDASRTLDTLVRCGVTTLCAPPTAWRALILEDLARFPVRLRELVSAGEPLNPEVIERVKAAWGLVIREGYGQTESTAMLGNPPGQAVRYGSMGRPLPGYALALLDPDGRSANEGEVSVVLDPRPAGLMAGYAGDEAKTHKALGGTHYGTGDVATRDAEGYFWFVGRTDDVFKSSDYRISPFELESALIEHPAVAEAAVVESPDEKRLCVPKACVVLKPGLQPTAEQAQAILAFARGRLAPYQRIRIIEFCELPKTVSGKIRRTDLRAAEALRRKAGQREPLEFFETDFPELGTPREEGKP